MRARAGPIVKMLDAEFDERTAVKETGIDFGATNAHREPKWRGKSWWAHLAELASQ